MYENDFITRDVVEVDIKGRPFKIRILNGEESDQLDSKYTIMIGDGFKVDSAEKNKEFLLKVVADCPYEKDGKKFKDMTADEKLNILQNLKPELRGGIFKAYADLTKLTEEEAKK